MFYFRNGFAPTPFQVNTITRPLKSLSWANMCAMRYIYINRLLRQTSNKEMICSYRIKNKHLIDVRMFRQLRRGTILLRIRLLGENQIQCNRFITDKGIPTFDTVYNGYFTIKHSHWREKNYIFEIAIDRLKILKNKTKKLHTASVVHVTTSSTYCQG